MSKTQSTNFEAVQGTTKGLHAAGVMEQVMTVNLTVKILLAEKNSIRDNGLEVRRQSSGSDSHCAS